MGQWGRFLQIKHEAYSGSLSCAVQFLSGACWYKEADIKIRFTAAEPDYLL